jgi:hypothetical protein
LFGFECQGLARSWQPHSNQEAKAPPMQAFNPKINICGHYVHCICGPTKEPSTDLHFSAFDLAAKIMRATIIADNVPLQIQLSATNRNDNHEFSSRYFKLRHFLSGEQQIH